ncbi:MAG: hypothetical protein ACLSWI_03655 [Candidatus Gastranaerophilaceae bacterium]
MMVSNRITEGVGKKIVEALKMQSEIEIQQVVDNPAIEEAPANVSEETPDIEFVNDSDSMNDSNDYHQDSISENTHNFSGFQPSNNFESVSMMPFQQNQSFDKDNFANDLDGFEIPTNVAVLKQLINQLPSGVSKQTGAQIIRQTMEALGISMKSVLQEAQQVQEGLTNSSRECQATIMEYKRQIGVLEKQSQKYQRQYSALNDIISLFIQTNN